MFTGPVGPVEVFFYWPEAVFGNFYWPGAIGLPLASSPEMLNTVMPKTYPIKNWSSNTLVEQWAVLKIYTDSQH